MKKIYLLLLALFAGIVLNAADVMLRDDNMQMPMERTWWLSVKNDSSAFVKESKQFIFAHRLRLRFISNKQRFAKFEIIEAATGKVVWQTVKFNRSLWAPIPKPGEYITRITGNAGSGECHVAIDSYVKLPGAKNFTALQSWRYPDHTKVAVAPDGGIVLTPTGKWDRIGAATYGLTPGKTYRLEFEISSFESQEVFVRATWGRGKNAVTLDKKLNLIPANGRQSLKLEFTPNVDRMSITIYMVKKLQIHKFRLFQTVRKEQPFRMIGKNRALYESRNPYGEPANPAIKAPSAFRRAPRMVYFDSVPQAHEIIKSVDSFSNPGEYAVWHFVMHNPVGDRTVGGIKVSDLKNGSNVIPANKIALNFVEFQDYPSFTHNYMNIPERILPLDMKAADTLNRMFWLQTKLPDNTAPGIYSGKVEVICSGKPVVLPIRLRVLPFKLRNPSPHRMHWATYSNLYHNQKRHYSADTHHRYVMDMKEYGMDAMHVNVGGGREDNIKRTQSIRRRANMNGPLYLAGTMIERQAARACGYVMAKTNNPNHLIYTKGDKRGFWFEFEDVRKKFVEICKDYRKWVDKYGGEGFNDCYILGHDEAHLHKDLFRSAVWQFRLYHEAGFKSIATVYPPERVADLGPYLDISNNMLAGSNAGVEAKLNAIRKRFPQLKIVYLGAGSYRGQEGGLMPNRLLAGFLSYKIGCAGHLSYTYQEPPYPVDHFARGKVYNLVYPVSKRPTPARANYFTLQYEGIREGIVDYKYLYTLECLIAEARKAGRTAQADAAEKVLRSIVSGIPYADDIRGSGDGILQRQTFNNDSAESLRMLIANEIMKLQN